MGGGVLAKQHLRIGMSFAAAPLTLLTAVDPLGKTRRYLSRNAAIRIWPDCLVSCPIGIGSKCWARGRTALTHDRFPFG